MANKEFYQLTEAYDVAFSDRDFQDECNYYEWCFTSFAGEALLSQQQHSVIEIACGPANHARQFALKGWSAAGLDLSEDMLEYASMKDEQAGVQCSYYLQNMINFSTGNQYSMAVTPLESISHILTNQDLVTHLRTVAEHLQQGGIYIIESTHPRYFFPDNEENRWKVQHQGREIEILFGKPEDHYDHVQQVWDVTTGLKVSENGVVLHHVESKSKHRWYLYQELQALVQMANCFSEVHFFGSYDIPPHPLDNSDESDALVLVLRK